MKTIYKSIWGLGLVLSLNACSLDEYNPTSMSEEAMLSTFEGWKSYQTSCYFGLWGSLIGMPYGLVSELGTDLWTFPYGNHNQYKTLIAYEELTTSEGVIRNTWDFAWGSIKDCNKTIELAEKLEDRTADNASSIAILTAEARFLRAYYYSVLVTQFGEVPLVLVDDPAKNLSPQRTPVPEIYAQILSDLRYAFNNLGVDPYENNPGRVSKKSALGIMARVYAQGAGEGLREGDKSYWARAKEVADSVINLQSTYKVSLHPDFEDVFAAENNRNNAEALFTAYGLNPYDQASYSAFKGNSKPNLYLHYYPKFDDAFGTSDVFLKGVNKNTSNAYYGRCNQQFVAPTQYLIDCFDADYDKRWEHTFVTAFSNYSAEQAIASLGSGAPTPVKDWTYGKGTIELTQSICEKYGLDPSHIGKKIYPYVDVNSRNASPGATWQYIPKVWKAGVHDGDIANLIEVRNANVHPYPLAVNEDRFIAYLSKDKLSEADRKARAYITINLDDLFDQSDPTGSTYKKVEQGNGLTPISLANLFPAMQKFNHNFDGGWLGGNFQQKLGNIMVMRTAEAYLIAAEAALNINSGNGAAAAEYLNVLRRRACRNAADFTTTTGMQLTTATMDDVFDEYARELCGEYNRWAILKRNRAFESRLRSYNKAASENFDPAKHYLRPIPYKFLSQINNAEEFGSNGY